MQRLASLLRGSNRSSASPDDAELGGPLPTLREAPLSGAERLRAAQARLAAGAVSFGGGWRVFGIGTCKRYF